MISVEGVTSRYGRHTALSELSFTAGVGVCALLGPNGAGKTTVMSAIMGLRAFEGSIIVDGEQLSPRLMRSSMKNHGIGYLPQSFDLSGSLEVSKTVAYAAWVNGQERDKCADLADEALDRVALADKGRHKVKTLSGGERQRLGIACAIAHRPKILLLDEPTVGLDPNQRARLRKYLHAIGESCSVLLATHLLEDVQIIADHVVVMNRGAACFSGRPSDLADIGHGNNDPHESKLEAAYRLLIAASEEVD
jgi:ABC-2 type transport system ATP-binding protein